MEIKVDNMMVTQCEVRDDLPESREERLMQGVDIWTSFYRENPARFFQDYFELPLHPFQVYMFNMIDKHDGSSWITTRGLGKSFTIAGYLVTRAVLYPGLIFGSLYKAIYIVKFIELLGLPKVY